MTAEFTLTAGARFADRYEVVRKVAKGGMGTVFEVVHLETQRRRALKVMHDNIAETETFRQRFQQEARIGAHVQSDHVVEVFDAGIDAATKLPFMVMELLVGEELAVRSKRLGPLPLPEVALYLRQTAMALDATHAASIVHRDLKPENLFLTQRSDGSPCVKVLDFGIAKLVADTRTHIQKTRNLGTPAYMAPEQFKPGSIVSPATDIYALGLVAYALLVGTHYWADEAQREKNVFVFATIAISGPVEAASARAARQGVTLPAGFDDWFRRATAAEPSARFPSAGEAVAALSSLDGGASLAAPGVPASASPGAPAPYLPAGDTGGHVYTGDATGYLATGPFAAGATGYHLHTSEALPPGSAAMPFSGPASGTGQAAAGYHEPIAPPPASVAPPASGWGPAPPAHTLPSVVTQTPLSSVAGGKRGVPVVAVVLATLLGVGAVGGAVVLALRARGDARREQRAEAAAAAKDDESGGNKKKKKRQKASSAGRTYDDGEVVEVLLSNNVWYRGVVLDFEDGRHRVDVIGVDEPEEHQWMSAKSIRPARAWVVGDKVLVQITDDPRYRMLAGNVVEVKGEKTERRYRVTLVANMLPPRWVEDKDLSEAPF